MASYILDTNILIRSKNDMPFDLWPTFWNKMRLMIVNGQVFSCNHVKAEIDKGKDDLTEWINNNATDSFFISADEDVMTQYAATQRWANSIPSYKPEALQDFAIKADAYLIATAKAKGLTLVTYEKSSPSSQNRVMIPDVCAALGVRCCDLNTILRELGVII